ncbi:MAG: hypothetical protein OXT67_00100 [Zetaproteobacteria bacterium]|nr:hypothetical protein [Zetaproteobacteria bacterium]
MLSQNLIPIWFVSLSLAIVLVAVDVQARDDRWTHFGLRPLAMGNAYVSVADDHNAMFYNPAGLARIQEWDGEILNPYLEVSTNSLDFIEDAQNLSSTEGIADILSLLSSHTGKTNHFAFGLAPHLYGSGWGFATSFYMPATFVAHRYVEVEFKAGVDVMVPLSFATNLMQDRLSVGTTLKVIAQGGIDADLPLDSLTKLQNSEELQDLVKAGVGVGADFGLLFTPTEVMRPTLGLMISDLGGTPYSPAGDAGSVPAPKQMGIHAGVSVVPYDVDWMWLRTSVEGHELNQPKHYSKKFNVGAELGLGTLFKLQMGLRHGLLSSGIELDVGLLNLRLVTYALDHGVVVGQHARLEDRRYAMQMKLII